MSKWQSMESAPRDRTIIVWEYVNDEKDGAHVIACFCDGNWTDGSRDVTPVLWAELLSAPQKPPKRSRSGSTSAA